MTFERLNKIGKILRAKKYLEIGVQQGLTFAKIDLPFKVAVDPLFRFDYKKMSNQETLFFEKPSDSFFLNDLKDEKFDLIFLDGLHTYEQTLRDFIFSLTRSHDNTVWLIDDVAPSGYLAACANNTINKIARKTFGQPSWMGDVFKLVYTIHDFFPQYNYLTFPEHAQTIVWKEIRKDFKPKWNSLSKISKMNYFHFKKYSQEFLHYSSDELIFTRLKDRFSI